MTTDQRKARFVKRLRDLSKHTRHCELAKSLGVSRSVMRNWLYRNIPSVYAITVFEKKVNEKWRALRRNRKS